MTQDSHQLRLLLDGFCNRSLDEAQVRELDSLLQSDAEARKAYLAALNMEAELFSSHADLEAVPAEVAAPMVERQPTVKPQAARSFNWLAIAASLLAVAVGSSFVTRQFVQPVASAAAVRGADAALAKVTGTRNCRWSADARPFEYGQGIAAGEAVQLAGGLLQLTFADGARVILEGPAEFIVDSRDSAKLISGRLAAVAPPAAKSFTVTTPNLNVIQPAGEFGLVAGIEGGDEVHVFHGQLVARPVSALEDDGTALALGSKEAVRIFPASTTLARVTLQNDLFVRSLAPSSGPRDGLFAQDSFEYPAGPLSGQNGGFGWAGPWEVVELDEAETTATNVVVDGNLAPEQIALGQAPAVGGRAVQSGHRNRIRRGLGCTVGGVFDAAGLVENQDGQRLVGRSGRTVYLSFLQRVDKVADGFYGLELHRGDGNANRVLCIGNGAEGAGYGATSNFNAVRANNFPSLGEEHTGANYVVVKIQFGADNRDQVTVYRNPALLLAERDCQPTAQLTGNFAFDRVSFANFDGVKNHEIDEVRIGVSFPAVNGERDGFDGQLTSPVAAIFDESGRLAGSREMAVQETFFAGLLAERTPFGGHFSFLNK